MLRGDALTRPVVESIDNGKTWKEVLIHGGSVK